MQLLGQLGLLYFRKHPSAFEEIKVAKKIFKDRRTSLALG